MPNVENVSTDQRRSEGGRREPASCPGPAWLRGMLMVSPPVGESKVSLAAKDLETVLQGEPIPMWPHSVSISPFSSPVFTDLPQFPF